MNKINFFIIFFSSGKVKGLMPIILICVFRKLDLNDHPCDLETVHIMNSTNLVVKTRSDAHSKSMLREYPSVPCESRITSTVKQTVKQIAPIDMNREIPKLLLLLYFSC